MTGAMAYTIGTMGFGVMGNLIKLLLTLYAALVVFVLVVLLPVALIARLPIKRFVKAVAEPVSIAFATASSESALPRAMGSMQPLASAAIVAFVCPPAIASIWMAALSMSHWLLCRPGCWISLDLRPAVGHGFYPDAYQQSSWGRKAARGDGAPAGVPRIPFHLPQWPVVFFDSGH